MLAIFFMAIHSHKKKPGSHRVFVSSLAGAVPAWAAALHPVVSMDLGAEVREDLAAALVAGRRLFESRAWSSPWWVTIIQSRSGMRVAEDKRF